MRSFFSSVLRIFLQPTVRTVWLLGVVTSITAIFVIFLFVLPALSEARKSSQVIQFQQATQAEQMVERFFSERVRHILFESFLVSQNIQVGESEYLSWFIAKDGDLYDFARMQYLTLEGNVVEEIKNIETAALRPVNFSLQSLQKLYGETPKTFIMGDIFYSNNIAYVDIAVALTQESSQVFSVTVRLSGLWKKLHNLLSSELEVLYIVNRKGVVVFHTVLRGIVPGKTDFSIRRVVAQVMREGVVVKDPFSVPGYINEQGEQVRAVGIPLSKYNVGLFWERPESVIFAARNVIARSMIFWVLIIGLAIFVMVRSLLALGRTIQSLRVEQKKISTLIESLNVGVLFVNLHGGIELVNAKARYFLELEQQKWLGKEINFYSKVLPKNIIEIRQAAKWQRRESFASREAVYQKDVHLYAPEELYLRVTKIEGKGEKGVQELWGTLYVLEDLTQERKIQQRESFVAGLKSEFLSVAAHQLRTPLSVIKWVIALVLGGDFGEIKGEQREFLNKARESNEQMIKLVADLLDVSRIEEGMFEYKFTRFSLDNILKKVVEEQVHNATSRKIRVVFQSKTHSLKINGDKQKLILIFQNLLDNAIRYTLPGGHVTVKTVSDKEFVTVSITDTGIGIPKHEQPHLFTRFFRGAQAKKTQTEGSGLGLFIAREIAEKHGGSIWLASKEGGGTTFYVKLSLVSKNLKEEIA